MDETELLDALDRRAAGAVAALDDRVADVEPPHLPVEADRRRRRWTPFLVAAGLAVVALLGIGLALSGRDDEAGTIADDGGAPVETDDGGITRLALADPAALGYEVEAAFDGPAIEPGPESGTMSDLRHTAHGPAGAPDPWGAAIISMTVPADEYTFLGEVVDVGGPEASHVAVGPVDRVLWREGAEARTLMSGRVRGADLIEVARAAVTAGWTGDGPLPGHDVLREGTPDEFSLGLEYAAQLPNDWQGVAYRRPGGPQGTGFVIAARPGGSDVLQALLALEPSSRTASVAGRDVLISSSWRTATHASWLLDDGTVVQLATYADVDAVLEEVVDALTPVTDAEFDELVASHPVLAGTVLLDQPASAFEPMGDGPVVASVSLRDDSGTEHRLQVLRDGSDDLALVLETDDGGSGGPLRDLDTPTLSGRGTVGQPYVGSGVLPAGVPGDLAGSRFVDRVTGQEIELVNWVTGTFEPGGDPRLVIALLDADPSVARIDVTFPTGDGERTWRL